MKLYLQTPYYQDYLKNHASIDIEFVEEKSQAEVIISGSFKELDYHKDLKAVIVPYTGLDQIDLELIKKHQIPLYNTTDHSKFVAEKALQLLLALLGNVANFHNRLMHGDWSHRNSDERIPWVSLFNRKIGIYGYGRIGRIFQELTTPFTKEFYVIDRGKDYPNTTPVKDLETLVDKSEIIVIAAPLTEDTEGVFNANILSRMQDKYLINVGRGPIIEEEALYNALRNQTLKGFASDVWYQYPTQNKVRKSPTKFPIDQFKNIIVSPHCGGYTTDFYSVMAEPLLHYIECIAKNNFSQAIINRR